jgi:hypothetical protein
MRSLGLPAPIAAAVAGTSPATVRRWRARTRQRRPLRQRRGPVPGDVLTREQIVKVEAIVEACCGMIGAEALRHQIEGVSRRAAARIKARVMRKMEARRREACMRVHVSVPGIVRGFDAIEPRGSGSWGYLLRSADACVPYITSMPVTARYDANSVLDAIERDWADNGVPYVLRLDRAKAHLVEPLRDLADAQGVLLLFGPPHHPQFYGQLERGNRDVRVLDRASRPATPNSVYGWARQVCDTLNNLWPRRSLGFKTPADAWKGRPVVVEDRSALRAEVADLEERIRLHGTARVGPASLAERLAIEAALVHRGWLRREEGGWC